MIDWKELLMALLNTLLTFGENAVPVALVTLLVERLTQWIPALRPWRELIKQWLLKQIESMRLERAKTAVLAAGQEHRAALKTAAELGQAFTYTETKRLKDQRYNTALSLLENSGAATGAAAKTLIEAAVGDLRSKGINP